MLTFPLESPITLYGVLVLVGILWTAWVYGRTTGPRRDPRLTGLYFGCLLGALIGAKLSFLLAEGWAYGDDAKALLSGRSILGGLLGGYVAVELGKKKMGYEKTTGDLFALVAPMGLLLGRIGCLSQGCCPGRICSEETWYTLTDAAGSPRWPAAAVELGFNALFLVWVLLARRKGWCPENRFHVYLIAYGVFRFGHEFLRDNRAVAGSWTVYHALALALLLLGIVRYRARLR